MTSDKFSLENSFFYSTSEHEYRIWWTCIGNRSRPPLVFIHGTPWSAAVWHDLASALESRFRIYVYNHPGFEQSNQHHRLDGREPELDSSLELRAEASAALFKHWDFDQPPHVVAHDNGGLVSLRLYLQHGIQFASLCLIDVVAIGPLGSTFFNLVAGNQKVFKEIPPHMFVGFIQAYVRSAACKPLSKEVGDMLSNQWLPGGRQGPERFLQEMIQAHNRSIGEIEERYSLVGQQIPVKIIWGENDTWLPSERAARLGKALRAQEVVIVPEAGHLIHYDQPSRLALEVGLWLLADVQVAAR